MWSLLPREKDRIKGSIKGCPELSGRRVVCSHSGLETVDTERVSGLPASPETFAGFHAGAFAAVRAGSKNTVAVSACAGRGVDL